MDIFAPDLKEILLTKGEIESRVKELGLEIASEYKGKNPVLIGILKGVVVFFSDLIRNIELPLSIDFMATSSYGKSAYSSGAVKILKDLDLSIVHRDVILVEDIVDTGLTLKYIAENLKARNPASFKICVLLDKPDRRLVDIKLDYCGFKIPDEFVVGYGLDFAEKYRNLPFVAVLRPEVYLSDSKNL